MRAESFALPSRHIRALSLKEYHIEIKNSAGPEVTVSTIPAGGVLVGEHWKANYDACCVLHTKETEKLRRVQNLKQHLKRFVLVMYVRREFFHHLSL